MAAECEAGDPDFYKSIVFFDTESGDLLGTWVLPRAQSAQENCTIHNYNVIPNRKRDLLSVGAYQAGTSVVDFTDPARPKTVAWYDPPALGPAGLTLGGSWGSYWHNGFVYASEITKGLEVFRLEDRTLSWRRRPASVSSGGAASSMRWEPGSTPEGRFAQFCARRQRENEERRALLRRVALAASVLPPSCVGCELRLALVSRGRPADRLDAVLAGAR